MALVDQGTNEKVDRSFRIECPEENWILNSGDKKQGVRKPPDPLMMFW
jgi:hypothetical protein